MHKPTESADAPQAELRTTRMDLTVEYAVQMPIPAAASPTLLLALHGWGQTCVSFIQAFAPLQAHGSLVIAPQAPHPFYIDPVQKRVGFSWLTRHRREEAVADVNRHLEHLIDQFADSPGFGTRRLFLLGFSQGASMAYRFAMRTQRPVAGVVACSADLPPDVAAQLQTRPPLRVLLIHGHLDRIVPPGAMADAKAILTAAQFPVETATYRCGHRIAPQAVARIAAWMDASAR